MKRGLFILTLLMSLLAGTVHSQSDPSAEAERFLLERGEVYFSFRMNDRDEMHRLTRIISIDRVEGKQVFAYANREGFVKFRATGHKFNVLTPPGLAVRAEDFVSSGPARERTNWNFYPTYQEYLDFMAGFAADHPAICRIDTVGTTVQGRLILAARISNNVGIEEAEPQFLYTATIHGDETTGYVLMLHLIDYLLTGYGTDPAITDMLNTTEICINPLANPDGTYFSGNNSVLGSRRFNANGVDLNRNFPDPRTGPHPDGLEWQAETVAWMDYADRNHFTMSANFHGGEEVFNYPWDTWSKLPADDDWWQFVGREWADTVHQYAPSGYFTFMQNGVTNGYAWYMITGGRQDYMNYFHHCREVTVEISYDKILSPSLLTPFWDYNYRSFLNYMKQANYGINGIVTDTVTDLPVAAKVFIHGHDVDYSEVYSRETTGFYARHIDEGTWDLTFSAPGYYTKIIKDVPVSRREATQLDVQLRPLTYDAQDRSVGRLMLWPNPSDGHFSLRLPDEPVKAHSSLQVLDALGRIVHTRDLTEVPAGRTAEIMLPGFVPGIYYLRFNSGYRIYVDKMVIRK